jgi:hypothetical protein
MRPIVQGRWPRLILLNLSTCKVKSDDNIIGDEGVDHLRRSNWPELRFLLLSILHVI